MVAAARGLGFEGAHIGGFGLTHHDLVAILDRALAIGPSWRCRLDELVFDSPGQFYLFPRRSDGLSEGSGPYQYGIHKPRASWQQRFSALAHRLFISPDSRAAALFARWLSPGAPPWLAAAARAALKPSVWYRKAFFDCLSCGDCIQDHLSYAGCSLSGCHKGLRNGPCGGSRPDGSCEARPGTPCLWNQVYLASLALDQDPRRFARTLIPPRDWRLDGSNSLVNRFAGCDNFRRRLKLSRQPGDVHVPHR
jgi:methylenetetrahydrofolate reductase (NADPH)